MNTDDFSDSLDEYYRSHDTFVRQQAERIQATPVPSVGLAWGRRVIGNDIRCETVTGFSCQQIALLMDACKHNFRNAHRLKKRGRRAMQMEDRDSLLLVLCHVKHYETLDILARTTVLNKTKVWRSLQFALSPAAQGLFNRYVTSQEVRGSVVSCDVFQPIWIPEKNVSVDRHSYFSHEFGQYGLRTRCTFDSMTGLLLLFEPSRPAQDDDTTATVPLTEPILRWLKQFKERHYIMTTVYRGERDAVYGRYFLLCAALTNAHQLFTSTEGGLVTSSNGDE
jgi:hypothetical protein